MTPSNYALELMKAQSLEKALLIAEEHAKNSRMLTGMEDVPPYAEEVEITIEFYSDKEGNEKKREKIKIDKVMQNKRLIASAKFWENVYAILRKKKTNREETKAKKH